MATLKCIENNNIQIHIVIRSHKVNVRRIISNQDYLYDISVNSEIGKNVPL